MIDVDALINELAGQPRPLVDHVRQAFYAGVRTERERLLGTDLDGPAPTAIRDAYEAGATSERERIVALIREYANECMTRDESIPDHIRFAQKSLVEDVADTVAKLDTTTGEGS